PLTNAGNATLNVSSISAPAGFGLLTHCAGTFSPNTSCGIAVIFSPTTTGPQTGELLVYDDAPGSPQSVSLSGTGTNTAPVVTLSPSSLTFGDQLAGSTSATQTVILSNTGGATLTVSSIAATWSFGETNNCGSSVAVGSSCT